MALASPAITASAVDRRLHRQGIDIVSVAFRIALLSSLLVSLLFLVVLIGTVFFKGIGVFTGVFADLPLVGDWVTEPPSGSRGLEFLTTGNAGSAERAGVWQALLGSALIAGFVVVLAFPIGVGAAVYMEEYARPNRLTRFININIRNLAGVPSIVYGILGLSLFVKSLDWFTGGTTVIAAGMVLAVLVLPIVIITSSEAIRAVPDSIREAGFGVGASRWEVVRSHVLPYAAPGILTGTVLSLARALGEAAPLILIGAKTGFFASGESQSLLDRLQGPFTALPNLVFGWAKQPSQGWPANTAAAILVMLVVVLSANAVAILLRNHYDKKRDA